MKKLRCKEVKKCFQKTQEAKPGYKLSTLAPKTELLITLGRNLPSFCGNTSRGEELINTQTA